MQLQYYTLISLKIIIKIYIRLSLQIYSTQHMQLKDNHYYIQNLNLIDICQEFGTPLYVYDADKIIEKIHNLQEAFAGLPLKLKYAAKALTNISVLKLMKKQGIG